MKKQPSLHRRTLLAAVAAATLLAAGGAAAQSDWPRGQPIKLIVPFTAGSGTDIVARIVAERLGPALGTTVLVDNRPGAGGTTGADAVAKSAPDGYTLLMGVTGSNAISASLYPKLPYDPVKDFAFVCQVVSAPLVLSVNATSNIKTVRDYLAAAHAKPMTYASPGNGTSMHLTGEMFDLATGAKMTHVPYRGSAPAMNDLLGGNVQSMFGDFLVLLPQIRAGKVTPIAVSSSKRHPLLPDVPTIAEAATGPNGIPALAGFEASSWQGLFAPAGTPRDVVAKLQAEVAKALDGADIKEFFGSQGFIVAASTPEQFKSLIEAEVPKWARVVKAANVTPD